MDHFFSTDENELYTNVSAVNYGSETTDPRLTVGLNETRGLTGGYPLLLYRNVCLTTLCQGLRRAILAPLQPNMLPVRLSRTGIIPKQSLRSKQLRSYPSTSLRLGSPRPSFTSIMRAATLLKPYLRI